MDDDADGEFCLLAKGSLMFSEDSDFGWLLLLPLATLSKKKSEKKY